MRSNPLRWLGLGLAALCAAGSASAYSLLLNSTTGDVIRWRPGTVNFELKISNSVSFSDGTSRVSTTQQAMTDWNNEIGQVVFSGSAATVGDGTSGNSVNEVWFSTETAPGQTFDASTLAVTLSWRSGDWRTESDIVFNSSFPWDSYRGTLSASKDMRRVAIHELGHALGLNHPDQAGQSVVAVMNSTISSEADGLKQDDKDGGHRLYGASGAVPANNNFAAATTIAAGGGTVYGDTIGATAESGEPSHGAGAPARRTAWWKWTPTGSGSATITTFGSDFDTILAVYTGNAVGSLTQQASNDESSDTNSQSTVTFNAVAGTTYAIAVDGWDGFYGQVTLSVQAPPTLSPPVITSPNTASVAGGTDFWFMITTNPPSGVSPITYTASPLPTGLGFNTSTGVISGVPTVPGTYFINLSATNAAGTGYGALMLTVVAVGPAITVSNATRNVLSPGESLQLSASVSSLATLSSYQWYRNGRPVGSGNGYTLSLPSVTSADSGAYWFVATDMYGTTRSAPIFVQVAPIATEVTAWGGNGSSQLQVPSGLGRVVSIAAGSGHTLAVKLDGTVAAWGSPTSSFGQSTVPGNLANVVAVAGGGFHSLALKADGTVTGWGGNFAGQTTIPNGLANVVAIAAGEAFSLALKTDGTVTAWGYNLTGSTNVPVGLTNVVAIAAMGNIALALKADGTVVTWGEANNGVPSVPSGLVATDVSAGTNHVLALKGDGTVVAWGSNINGGTTVPGGLSGVTKVSAGADFSTALKSNGTVVAWGLNTSGQATVPGGLNNAVQLAAGGVHVAVLKDMSAFVPGFTAHPQSVSAAWLTEAQFTVTATNTTSATYQWQRKPVGSLTWSNLADDLSYQPGYLGTHTATLRVTSVQVANTGDQFRCLVTNPYGSVVSNAATLTVYRPAYTRISAGRYHSLRLDVLGRALGYGAESYGELSTYLSGFNVAAFAAGAQFTLLLMDNGQLMGVGYNLDGQLGDTTKVTKTTLVTIDTNVVAVAACRLHSAYLKADGTLWTAGGNDEGQVGDGTTTDRPTPVQIATQVVDLAVGLRQTLFLKSDGTLWGVGDLYNNGTLTSTPIQLATGVKGLAAGGYHSVFVKTDGTAWTLGWNAFGQLGNGTTTTATTPVQVATNVRSVAAGYFHTLLIKNDDTLWSFGRNDYGQIGDGTNTNRLTPYQLATGVALVSASESYTLFTKLDGGLWGTGLNGNGQFGNGNTTTVSSPVLITAAVTAAPSVPSSLAAAAGNGNDRVRLTWKPAPTASSYEVWRSTTNSFGTATRIAQDLRWSLYEDRTAAAGTTYYYWVIASNSGGTSSAPTPVSGSYGASANSPVRDFNADGYSDILWENTTSGERAFWLLNGTAQPSWLALGQLPSAWRMAAVADLSGDGKPDIVWENTSTGQHYLWVMNGTAYSSGANLATLPVEWRVVGAGDFNADGKADLLWENTSTGQRVIWYMNGTVNTGSTGLGSIPVAWHIAAVADFNADTKPDILWENTTTGDRSIWLMNGSTVSSVVGLGTLSTQWRMIAAADFNSDAKTDILWFNSTTGELGCWIMNGTSYSDWLGLGLLPLDWNLAPVCAGDFNADGKTDILWQNLTTGDRGLWLMHGSPFPLWVFIGTVPTVWHLAGSADLTNDGKRDLVWENTSTGDRVVWVLNGTTQTGTQSVATLDPAWKMAAFADFNADGKPDIVWQNTSTGDRVIWFMSGTANTGSIGLGGIPVAWKIAATGDFNGDGKPDILWQNTTTGDIGIWLMNGSSYLGWAGLGTIDPVWRMAGAADYNNDGQTDILWENTSTGERGYWIMNGSTNTGWFQIGVVPPAWKSGN